MAIPFSDKFKLPTTTTYDGTKDPLELLEYFNSWIDLYAYKDVAYLDRQC